MTTPLEIAKEIVDREGGYVNDQDDPGGPTKWGVTLATVKRLGIDVDGDGDSDIDDVKILTPEIAIEVFLTHYYRIPKIDRIANKYPQRGITLRASVMDMNVNAGSRSIKILQQLCNTCGSNLQVDGIIGSGTLIAIRKVADKGIEILADAYAIERRNFYYRLADNRTQFQKYCLTRKGGKGGWIHRAEEFMSVRYHYTQAQHEQRTAAW